MSELDDRNRGADRDHTAHVPAREPTPPTPVSPAELARNALASATREVNAAEQADANVRSAQQANNLDAWRALHDPCTKSLDDASQTIARAREASQGQESAPLDALEKRLAALTSKSAELDIAPRGYVEVALEAELLAAIRRRPEGSAHDGFARKETEVSALMAQLTPADSKSLFARIAKKRPEDQLVAAFVTPSNLGPDRQKRLLAVLDDAPRREALRIGREQAAGQRARGSSQDRVAPPPTGDPQAQPVSAADRPESSAEPYGPDPTTRVPSASIEDTRVATTAAQPQLARHGHAMQYYQLHQPAFLAAVRARLLAAHLGTGSPQLSWTHGAAGFVDELGFALSGPASSELPELLYPADPWALIDAQRTMDGDPTLQTGAMGWAPGAGFALAGAVEAAVRASLPRMAARYVTAHAACTASELIASHPIDRIVALALCADDVVSLRSGKTAPANVSPGHDVQADGLRLVTSYHWLGEQDPSLWNWIRVDEPANATPEEIALTLWNRTDCAYALTVIDGNVAIPKEWARHLPGVVMREHAGPAELELFERSPAEQLAASKLGDGVALVQGQRASSGEAARPSTHPAPIAPDRAHLVDTLDSSSAILDDLRAQLTPWRLADVLEPGRAFVARQRAALPAAAPANITAWAPVITGQRAIMGEAAAGMLQTLQLLAEAGVTPTQLLPQDHSHPGLQVLYGYASAAATAQLVDSARVTLTHARAAHAMLPVNLIARAGTDARREVSRFQQSAGDDRVAASRAGELTEDHARLTAETATLQSQMMAIGSPDPALLDSAGLDAATLGLRAHLAQLRAALRALGGALDTADEGVLAALANLSAGTRMVMTAHHLAAASTALGAVETRLDASQPVRVNAKYDAMPPSADRARARHFELHETRKAQLALAQQQFAEVVKRHQLDGGLFERAEQAIHDAQLRRLIANVAALLAVGVISGGVAAIAGEFAAGLAGGGRVVTTIGEATGALRTARIVGGVTNAAVDAGLNASAQTALNGEHLGSSFAENLLTNAAIRAALHPLHAVIRTWGGLDEEAYALWTQQGGQWKVAAAKTTVVTTELITSAATSYVVHRLATRARGETPDDQTIAGWAVQGATLALAHAINRRLTDALARLRTAGALAGELIGRMQAQRHLAQAVGEADRIDHGVAMQLLVNHRQSLEDEISLWRKVASDPEALRSLGLDRAQVAAKLAGAEAQTADTQSQAFRYLPLRFAGLLQEVEGGRLWVGDPEQVAEAIANAHAAKLTIDAVPPDTAGSGVHIWHVTLNGESLQIRERARPGRASSPAGTPSAAEQRPPQRTGGRYDVLDDPTADILSDPEPTPEIRKLCDEARAAHPGDVEGQRDYVWRQLKAGELRKSLLARGPKDVELVSKALNDFGIAEATPKAVTEVFEYIFDSSGIAFSYDNYASWTRLAAGRGRITDARFLVHEFAEVSLLKKEGVDFMGRSLRIRSPAHRHWTGNTFEPAYFRAHKQALRTEYQFLADQLSHVTGAEHRLTPQEVAAIAGTLDESGAQVCKYMNTPDGPTVSEHPAFLAWQHRATEMVNLSAETAQGLGIPQHTTLGDLLRAIREAPLSTIRSEQGEVP